MDAPKSSQPRIESLHTGMMINVWEGGDVSDTFAIANGGIQGCVLAATYINMFLSAIVDGQYVF